MEAGGYAMHKRELRKTRMNAIEGAPARATMTAAERARCVELVQERADRLASLQTEQDVRDFHTMLQERPEALFLLLGVDLTRQVEDMLVGLACPDKQQQGRRDALYEQLRRLKESLAAPDSPPLVTLLADRVVLTLLDLNLAEIEYHGTRQSLKSPAGRDVATLVKAKIEALERRLDHAHRRYLSALKAMAFVAERPPAGPVRVRAAAKAGDAKKCVVAVEMQSATSEASGASTPGTPRRP
jgi:hypothetical protein